jgi:multidrug efflux pump subunit AcrA (membrane-fusion protein)
VPQSFLVSIRTGTAAELSVPERPGKAYAARVETASGAIDPSTGTMRTQLVVDNKDRELVPGSFASVHLDITGHDGTLSVAASAVIFDRGGLQVATVDASGIVAFKKILIARDLGNIVEVASGLAATDRVVQNPPDDLVGGNTFGSWVTVSPMFPLPPRVTSAKADLPAEDRPAGYAECHLQFKSRLVHFLVLRRSRRRV